ncbi:MAG: hypothetical protein CMM07_09560 [Rhodopirellula sp.]|nr:hypothetical protein [Rhodopirellula sp.]
MFADSGDDHESRLIPSIESVGIAGRTRAGSRVAVAFRRAPLKPGACPFWSTPSRCCGPAHPM